VVPTIVEALGIAGSPHRVEGRSLMPLLRADSLPPWRDAVFAELDYGFRRARQVLGRGVRDCRAVMVRTDDWKYVHWEGFRAQLFDLAADPLEQCDLGADPRCDAVRARMRERLFDWLAASKRRTTVDDAEVEARTDTHRRHGIHIGIW
jgi:arylsulfatase A-like enzyme